jgi:hypothetical protein
MTQSSPLVDLSALYTPHAKQQRIHNSAAKNKWLEMARRFGKSRLALFELLRCWTDSLNIPVSYSLVPPFHAWVAVPAFPQGRQVWNELLAFIPEQMIQPGGIRTDDKLIYLEGNENRSWGLIELKTCHDASALQTAGLDFLWVSEAQDVSNAAFEKLLPTIRDPNRMGRFLAEGIPSLYADHWFWRGCDAAERGNEGHQYFHGEYMDNPMLTQADITEIDADRELLPDRVWRRMYLAERSEDAGFFANISECTGGDLLPYPVPGGKYVAGLDLGRKVDPSVFHVLDASDRRLVFHYAFDTGAAWPLQREYIGRFCKDWEVQRLVVDATGMGGDIFVGELFEAGLPVEPFIINSAATRENLLQTLQVAIERETIRFPRVEGLLRQLRAFQYHRLPSGRFKAEAPAGEHDDEVFALALALTACDPPPNVAAYSLGHYNGRYVPTQEEANNGRGLPRGLGARMARDRVLGRVRDRQDTAGIS